MSVITAPPVRYVLKASQRVGSPTHPWVQNNLAARVLQCEDVKICWDLDPLRQNISYVPTEI